MKITHTPTPSKAEVELKPCPFCGFTPHSYEVGIYCEYTTCPVRPHAINSVLWNTRAIDAETLALRKELHSAVVLIQAMLKTFEAMGHDSMARIDSRVWAKYYADKTALILSTYFLASEKETK